LLRRCEVRTEQISVGWVNPFRLDHTKGTVVVSRGAESWSHSLMLSCRPNGTAFSREPRVLGASTGQCARRGSSAATPC
jgi:hypothetical protein